MKPEEIKKQEEEQLLDEDQLDNVAGGTENKCRKRKK